MVRVGRWREAGQPCGVSGPPAVRCPDDRGRGWVTSLPSDALRTAGEPSTTQTLPSRLQHPKPVSKHRPGSCYTSYMSAELVAILAAAVALAGLILNGQYRLVARIDAMQATMADIDRRLARVEGILSVTHAPAEPSSAA